MARAVAGLNLQAVILCGGRGLRLQEETEFRPKALVAVGGLPILWHILKLYDHYGVREFILCLGYKGEMIKEYFLNFDWETSDFVLDCASGRRRTLFPNRLLGDWRLTFVDTGASTQTGGRLRRVAACIRGEHFFVTYGDGVADVNLERLLEVHLARGTIGTVTGVHPSSPFGVLEVQDGLARSFREKPRVEGLVNGGFFVFRRAIFDYLDGDDCLLEEEPLRRLSRESSLAVYQHDGFWACMDTVKDVERLNHLWREGAPWRVWD